MDPLSVTASVIAILQFAGASGQALNTILSLRDAPQHLQQLWNEAEALRALLLETQNSLEHRRKADGYEQVRASITPILQTVEEHVREYEQICVRLTRNGIFDSKGRPKVKWPYWVRAGPEIQRIKQNIRDSREILKGRLELLGLDDSTKLKTRVLHIQQIALTNQDTIHELVYSQQDLKHEFRQMYIEQSQNFAALQTSFETSLRPLTTQMEGMALALNGPTQSRYPLIRNTQISLHENEPLQNNSSIQVSATIASQQCPTGCRCQCHIRTWIRSPMWLRNTFGQLFWSYNSSISMRSCNYSPCRKSLGKHSFTYYFPRWLVSRVIMASANLNDLYGAGAKVLVNIPLVVPEEDHLVWSLVIAGNLEQLRQLVSHDQNLIHVRNQWGQSIMHVAAKINQPGIFNYLISIGMDEHLPDENQKTAATTVLTRRGNLDFALSIDAEDLADRLGWTILHRVAALTREGLRLTEALLKSEFDDINTRDVLGRTPLHWLAENGDTEAIQLLTQDPWKADVYTRDNCGFTALHCACWADSFESASVLLDAGSDANARDKHKRTPMMHFDDHKMLDLMIEKGADVFISDDEGANIMHHVTVSNQANLAKILLESYDHTICIQNHCGDIPLGLAIQNNSVDVLEILIPFLEEFPIEKVRMSNHNRQNALHLAALHATIEVMDMLSEANLLGLDATAQDKDGHTPNECFLKCRDTHCAVARKSFDEEKQYWVKLMKSVQGQSKVSVLIVDIDESGETVVVPQESCNKRKDSGYVSGSTDYESEDDFVDAEEEVIVDLLQNPEQRLSIS